MSLRERVALVTGVSGAGQIGQAVALTLAREGARLSLVARSPGPLSERAAEVEQAGAEVIALPADVAAEAGVARVVEGTLAKFGRIDALISLAGGLTVYKPGDEHSYAEWMREIQNNLVSAFLLTRAVFPVMKAQGGGCVILFSRAGLPQANMLAYNCAKAGVDALTRTFALEGRQANIRVNAVAPGLTDTQANLTAMNPKEMSKWTAREDVASAVLFLASDAAHGINGQVVQVAGKGI